MQENDIPFTYAINNAIHGKAALDAREKAGFSAASSKAFPGKARNAVNLNPPPPPTLDFIAIQRSTPQDLGVLLQAAPAISINFETIPIRSIKKISYKGTAVLPVCGRLYCPTPRLAAARGCDTPFEIFDILRGSNKATFI
jgi:hypothetical protein